MMKMKHKQSRVFQLTFALLLVFVVGCLVECTKPIELKDLDTYITFKLERDHVPGLAACIIHGDDVVWSRGYGYANLDTKVPVASSTVFGIGSIGKSITAVAVLQLQEQGKLDIKKPVNDYLTFKVQHPQHPEAVITIEQILSHTSSISNGPSLWRNYHRGDDSIGLANWAHGYFLPEGKFWHPEGNFERWAPGTGFQYSNAGYGLLAYLVEVVSGMNFSTYCKQNIFDPLEMHNTSNWITNLDTATLVTMYAWGELWDIERDYLVRPGIDVSDTINTDRYVPLCYYTASPPKGAGSEFTRVDQIAHFLIKLMNHGTYKNKRILSEESVNLMFSPMVDRKHLPPWFVDVGLGGYAWRLDNGESVWGKTGADPGISTYMLFNTEIDMGAIVLANRFVDIRDLISWLFAEGFNAFGDKNIVAKNSIWGHYSDYDGEALKPKRKVTVRVEPQILPENDRLYVNGNHRYLGGWISKGIPLARQNDGAWQTTFFFHDSTELSFKITRGSWDKQAVLADGTVPEPHKHTVRGDTTLTITVANWKDTFGK